MKFLFSLIVMSISTQLLAATVELGKYLAVPVEYPTAVALIELKADNTASLKIDVDGFSIFCVGTFNVQENFLNSHVNCDHPDVPEVNANIDFTDVTAENLRSESGVDVPAKFDLLGDEAAMVNLKKADEQF